MPEKKNRCEKKTEGKKIQRFIFFILWLYVMGVKKRKSIVYTLCCVKDKMSKLDIDRKYWINMTSTIMVEKLGLPVLEHHDPYPLESLDDPEFKDLGYVKVTEQVLVSFKLEGNKGEALCDVVPTKTRHLLLGRPWRRQRQARHVKEKQEEIDKDENFKKEEESFRSEKESGVQKVEIFFHNP